MLGSSAFLKQKKNGAPGAIRTPGPQIRSLVLYPAELRVHTASAIRPRLRKAQGFFDETARAVNKGGGGGRISDRFLG